jgi:putative hemolysin
MNSQEASAVNKHVAINLDEVPGPVLKTVAKLLAKPLKLTNINDIYRRVMEDTSGGNFFDRCLREMDISYSISDEDRARIPLSGPTLVVANHPYGGADGIILGSLLTAMREDSKLLVNYLLGAMEGLRPWIIQVDPFGGKDAARSNLGPMRDAMRQLKDGHLLATFPSGTVSHLHLRKRIVTDPLWNTNTASLIRRTGATVLPVYFHGRNRNFFQAAGLLHPSMRTALLASEVVAMQGSDVKVSVGNPIPAAKLAKFKDNGDMMEFLRMKTYILNNRDKQATKPKRVHFPKIQRRKSVSTDEKIIDAVSTELLLKDIKGLPENAELVTHKSFSVFVAQATQIPNVLRELGRLREITFRDVGEGTGKSIDLDSFDEYYYHLFMWNHDEQEIVGAYRLGLTDWILENKGKKGVYTTTLFHYKHKVLNRLSPAIELGRSFICSKYQRKHASLSMIWRGIGAFVAQNPKYRVLFGPVSISQNYHAMSKDLIVQFFKDSSAEHEFHKKVRAKNPPRPRTLSRTDKKRLQTAIKDIEDISALISELETDQKGVPVLLRQYLKLNATMLSFNVDPDFHNSVDGLVLVDLLKTDPKILTRFMGEEGATAFYKCQEKLDQKIPERV